MSANVGRVLVGVSLPWIPFSIAGETPPSKPIFERYDTVDGRHPAKPVEIYIYIESRKYWDIYHVNWCRISSINRITLKKIRASFFFLNLNLQARRRKPTGESTSQKKNGETSDLIMDVSGKIRVGPANICWT